MRRLTQHDRDDRGVVTHLRDRHDGGPRRSRPPRHRRRPLRHGEPAPPRTAPTPPCSPWPPTVRATGTATDRRLLAVPQEPDQTINTARCAAAARPTITVTKPVSDGLLLDAATPATSIARPPRRSGARSAPADRTFPITIGTASSQNLAFGRRHSAPTTRRHHAWPRTIRMARRAVARHVARRRFSRHAGNNDCAVGGLGRQRPSPVGPGGDLATTGHVHHQLNRSCAATDVLVPDLRRRLQPRRATARTTRSSATPCSASPATRSTAAATPEAWTATVPSDETWTAARHCIHGDFIEFVTSQGHDRTRAPTSAPASRLPLQLDQPQHTEGTTPP